MRTDCPFSACALVAFAAPHLVDFIFADERALFILVTTLLLCLAETGFRCGMRLHKANDEGRRSQIGGVQGAVLGLLGLLLGFTFAMAVARYDRHRGLVLKEANAIGTAWLRAGRLPEAHRASVRDLLGHYVEVRLKYEAFSRNPAKLAEGLQISAEIQSQLWRHAEAVATNAPTPLTVAFINALNDVIDVDAMRIDAMRDRIPTGVWVLLIVVAASGCFISGYGSGAHGLRWNLTSLLLPVLIAVVVLLIFDLTHNRQGVINISQQPLIDLQHTIESKQ